MTICGKINFIPLFEELSFESASNACRGLQKAYCGRTQCNEWLHELKSGYFNVSNKEQGRLLKEFGDEK